MRTPDEVLSEMNRDAETGFLAGDVIATYQVEATLVLAEQTKRIADLMDKYGVLVTDRSGAEFIVLGVRDVGR